MLRMNRACVVPVWAALLTVGLTLHALPACGDPEPFNAFFVPELSQIEVGEIAEITFEVDSTAAQFNGYEITIQYDPTIVEFVEAERGSLPTSYCGNQWWWMDQTDSTVTLSHVILCAGVAMDGPGELSIWRFQGVAEGISPITIINDPDFTFVDAGEWVNPAHPTFPRQVFLTHAAIQVGDATSVAGEAPVYSLRSLLNVPNPFNPRTEIRFQLDRAGETTLEIRDIHGHLIWERNWRHLGAGPHRVAWQARDAEGRALPSGVYYSRLIAPHTSMTRSMTLIR